MDCESGHHLEAADDERLIEEGRAHIAKEHPEMNVSDDQLREMISANAYDA